MLLFPGLNDDLLHAERRPMVPVESPEDRAKLCLEELFRGPQPGLLAAVPDGVHVKEVFILDDGTAYADLSSDLLGKLNGSTRERLAVYAIVDTLAINVPGLKRVGLLVDGALRETLGGHLDTARPLLPDFDIVEASVRPAPAGGASSAAPGAPDAAGQGTAAQGSVSTDTDATTTAPGSPSTGEPDGSGATPDGGSAPPPKPPGAHA